MRIADRELSGDGPPYVIAELGVNHDGDVDTAVALVDAARRAGADAVKLQMFDAKRLLSRAALLADYQRRAGSADPLAMLERLELGADALARVVREARAVGLHAIVTIFNVDLVDVAAEQPWDAFKLASPDLVNHPLLRRVLETGRPLLLSTGAATLDEVCAALAIVGDRPHVLLQCVSAYPTPPERAGLGGIAALRRVTRGVIGYSDHTVDVDTGALAVAAGARVLEKHLTHDRHAPGPDHAASLDPASFRAYVERARRAHAMLGRAEKTVLDIERDVRRAARQSLVTARDLPKGATLTPDDLVVKRPGTGLPPGMLEAVVGRRLAGDVAADTPLREVDLA